MTLPRAQHTTTRDGGGPERVELQERQVGQEADSSRKKARTTELSLTTVTPVLGGGGVENPSFVMSSLIEAANSTLREAVRGAPRGSRDGGCGGTLGLVCEEFVLEKRHILVLPGLVSEDCERTCATTIDSVGPTEADSEAQPPLRLGFIRGESPVQTVCHCVGTDSQFWVSQRWKLRSVHGGVWCWCPNTATTDNLSTNGIRTPRSSSPLLKRFKS